MLPNADDDDVSVLAVFVLLFSFFSLNYETTHNLLKVALKFLSRASPLRKTLFSINNFHIPVS